MWFPIVKLLLVVIGWYCGPPNLTLLQHILRYHSPNSKKKLSNLIVHIHVLSLCIIIFDRTFNAFTHDPTSKTPIQEINGSSITIRNKRTNLIAPMTNSHLWILTVRSASFYLPSSQCTDAYTHAYTISFQIRRITLAQLHIYTSAKPICILLVFVPTFASQPDENDIR